jgi:hypothetical protein
MQSVFNGTDRTALGERMCGLTLEHTPKWGKMTCAQMLAHLTDGVRMALGEITVKPKRGPLRLGPVRYAVIYWLPFPKGAPTAPELLVRRAVNCEAEVGELKAALERMVAKAGTPRWVEHPAFGRMTERDWGVMVYRHIDHHLRQFGV